MILILDTAATGFIRWATNITASNQPHMTRLAMRLVEPESETVVEEFCSLVRPAERIGPEASTFWGITDEQAAQGMDPEEVCHKLVEYLQPASLVVAHSIDVHRKVCDRMAHLFAIDLPWPQQVCLMRCAAPIVAKPGRNRQNAWPKLGESYAHLVGSPLPARGSDPVENGRAMIAAAHEIYVALARLQALSVG
jgi:hypothetical protein